MLMEALVIATCLQSKGGCGESTNAYYRSNKEAMRTIQHVEKIGQKAIKGKEWLIYVATPLYAVAAGQQASVHLHERWTLNLDFKKEFAALQWSY